MAMAYHSSGGRPLMGRLPLLLLAAAWARGASARVSGYHVDDEACSGLNHDNITKQVPICAKFFGSLANTSEQLRSLSAKLGRAQPLRLAVDAGVGWVCPQQQPCTPPYCGCTNMSFNGSTKSVADHVVDIADEIVLMDYKKTAQQVYHYALPFMTYADGHPEGRKTIRVGVAIHNPGSKPQGFEVANEKEMAKLLSDSEQLLRQHRSFGGFAVFGDWWYSASLVKPAPTSTAWPRGTGVWYANHSMISSCDSNDITTCKTRDSWLKWAKSRGISEVYIAPHAGNDALISIGGVEGGPVTDKRFCDFVGLAQSAAGMEVQLMSSPLTDAHWFLNCSAANNGLVTGSRGAA